MTDRNAQVFGIDIRPGKRPPWWVLALIAVATIWLTYAVADGVRDAITTTDQERVAEALADFAAATADGDGDRACSLITKGSQIQAVAVVELATRSSVDCPAAFDYDVNRSQELGAEFGDLGDVDHAAIEDRVDVVGNIATVEDEGELVSTSLGAQQVGDAWLIDLTDEEVRPSGAVPGDASGEELRDAADEICRGAYTRSAVAIADFLAASRSNDEGDARAAAKRWSHSEGRLAEDLADLNTADERSTEIATLAAALNGEAAAIAALSGNASPARLATVIGARREVSRVADRQGFSAYGCAAPSLAGPRPTA